MFFLPLSVLFFLFLILLLPVLFFLIQIGAVGAAFSKLGMSPQVGFLVFSLSLLLSVVNIPLIEKEAPQLTTGLPEFMRYYFGLGSTITQRQVIAINVGGAIIPLLLVLYLLPRVPLGKTALAVAISTIVCKFLARPVAGMGIALPAFIPPVVSALLAMMLAPKNPAPVAYITGAVGTLVGADLLNLSRISQVGAGVVSIGGAGVFDGIYLAGIVAVLLS